MFRGFGLAHFLCLGLFVSVGCNDKSGSTGAQACTTGAEGCECGGDEQCDLNLTCVGDVCRDERSVPSVTKCYTPCARSAVINGVYVECDEDRLVEGCLGATECVRGTCVYKGDAAGDDALPEDDDSQAADAPPALETGVCKKETDCPSFQTCIQGHCYAECLENADCSGDKRCHLKVCRPACRASIETQGCPNKSYCATVDGDNGFCMPTTEVDAQQPEPGGAFELDLEFLSLSNVKNAGTITVINTSDFPMEFVARKLQHVEYGDDGATKETKMPLFWLNLVVGDTSACSASDSDEDDGTLAFVVAGNGGQAQVSICNADNDTLALWNGIVEIGSDSLGYQEVRLDYASKPEGQWEGKMYYFANFGTDNLDAWIAERNTPTGDELLASVGNALVWRWGAMRRGQISLDNFKAALQSAKSESWKWGTVADRCTEPLGACYPYDDYNGMESFTNDLRDRPIPSGMAELPIAMNLKSDTSDESLLTGKILSSETMHYAGDPSIRIHLLEQTDGCSDISTEACINYIDEIEADIVVGGRYYRAPGEAGCSSQEGFELIETPWLLQGFTDNTVVNASNGLRYREECRDTLQPYDENDMADVNLTFSGSNPIPDGRSRSRTIEVVDGAVVNQQEMIVLFRERFAEGSGEETGDNLTAYGVMVLSRDATTLDDSAYEGSEQFEQRDMKRGSLVGAKCKPAYVEQALGLTNLPSDWTPLPVDDSEALNALVMALITGSNRVSGADTVMTAADTGEEVHYLCHDTGLVDGGPEDDGELGAALAECPAGSHVTYFTLTDVVGCGTQADVAGWTCQLDGSCGDFVYDELYSTPSCLVRMDPYWKCADAEAQSCEVNRRDLRSGKVFYAEGDSTARFIPINGAVDDAFRYKTAFQNRDGRNIGFVPNICADSSNAVPYCYSPSDIEELTHRVDCAIAVFMNSKDELSPDVRSLLREFLIADFSTRGDQSDGFETLLTELSVMLGDNSYVAAFASRFDLAAVFTRSFEGEQFEPDGINLSGVAGYEMHSLYQAVQYYQLSLDRFYSLMPVLRESIKNQQTGNSIDGFITQETVTAYFDRLIRASSQKSRAWSEIAVRYQSFNRSDLARLVIERAYTATYLESVLLTRLIHEVSRVAKASDEAQIVSIIEQALLMYKAALIEMRDVYDSISDETTYFGYAAEYIPLPAMDAGDINAFEKLLDEAWDATDFARDKEDKALADTREFDVNSESFQSELVSIRNNYENQLGALCGWFPDPDGNMLPAIEKYAHIYPSYERLGDPCGWIGTGQIHDAMVGLHLRRLDFKQAFERRRAKLQQIEIEQERIVQVCAEADDGITAAQAREVTKAAIEGAISTTESIFDVLEAEVTEEASLNDLLKCNPPAPPPAPDPGNCALASALFTKQEVTYSAIKLVKTGLIPVKTVAEESLRAIETAEVLADLEGQCTLAQIDSEAVIKSLLTELLEQEIEIARMTEEVNLAVSNIDHLRNSAMRLQMEQKEAEQLAINIEAARNDPNIRIYKNDAIITADRTFEDALRKAYRASKVFEYYTSQSHARLSNLFLIRMVQAGDYSLENYLMELENAYMEFEEAYGNPDLRVAIVSLKDDIWKVNRNQNNGEATTEAERLKTFHEMLADPQLLDSNGYITIPFRTGISELSPLTRNHKINYIEAELLGTDVGDPVGRIYLRQRGTGTVRAVDGEKLYYAFPEKTAVLNTFFNGEHWPAFSDETLYKNERFRDLPYANTLWELVINQRDENVNLDINLQSLSDVRLYIYYTDFTEL